MNSIRVMIADDYEIIRHGIKRVLDYEENIAVVAEAVDGKDVLPQVEALAPDLLLLDMSMPGFSGLEILEKIRARKIKIKVIILTVENGSEYINKAIELGADGYVLKESTTTEIVEAINTVYEGNKYLDKSLMSMMFKKQSGGKYKVFAVLTEREVKILHGVSRGLSNREISEEVFLSEKTIKNNMTKIYKKLGVKDRVHAALLAVQNDIEGFMRD